MSGSSGSSRKREAAGEPSKEARKKAVLALKSLGGASDNSVVRIINTAREAGLFEADAKPLKKQELWDAGKELFASVKAVDKFPLTDDDREFELQYCEPNLLLAKLVAESEWLQRVWLRAARYRKRAPLRSALHRDVFDASGTP